MPHSEVDLATFAAAHAQGSPVIDVREPHEYARGHVPGARLIPLGHLPARIHEVPSDRAVYVICASGHRSLDAVSVLARFGRVGCSLRGGTSAWTQAGHPIVTGPDEDGR
ncbi:MAG TPA: rhodanese-like domain-containing protein [Verrucomicrobiae bacterium]|nr:rhodanese-like domain-containing protein [Verrucomicrobiae bacterium]